MVTQKAPKVTWEIDLEKQKGGLGEGKGKVCASYAIRRARHPFGPRRNIGGWRKRRERFWRWRRLYLLALKYWVADVVVRK